MEIKLAKESQLLEVLYILKECTEQLIDKGVKSWHNMHSDYADVAKDISSKFVYIIFLKNVPVGTVTIKPDAENSDASTIERLAIFPHFQKRGLAKAMIEFAEKHSREKDYKRITGKIPIDDEQLCKLLEDRGFKNMGTAQSLPNELVKVNYEKRLG